MRKIQDRIKWGVAVFWMMPLLVISETAVTSTAHGAPPMQKTMVQKLQLEPEGSYHFNPKGRIDPFTPLIPPEIATKKKDAKARILPLNPLQRLSIEQFRLVGIIEGEKERRAMVQDPSGRFYSLAQGAYIGLYNGRVESILKDRIIIGEKIVTDEGRMKPRKQIMKLRHNEVKP